MKCKSCNLKLWSTDNGICPKCHPEQSKVNYGVSPKENNIIEQKYVVETTELKGTLDDVAKMYTELVYLKNNKNKTKTAKELGVSLKTLYNHFDRYGWV